MKSVALSICCSTLALACGAAIDTDATSGVTNWLTCDSDGECSAVADGLCDEDGYCVDADGKRVTREASELEAEPEVQADEEDGEARAPEPVSMSGVDGGSMTPSESQDVGIDAGATVEIADGSSGAEGGAMNATPVPEDPYAPREGSFNVLVFSKTTEFRHISSIITGQALLEDIAEEWDFSVEFTETNENFTVEGLSQFELVFFLNTTGNILTDVEESAFEEWMTGHNGAFVGTHSATDTERGWPFYSDVTGQYYSGHGPAGTVGTIDFEPTLLDHPALVGLPNPWQRTEEWMLFDDHETWSTERGFQILGRKTADGQPIIWTREWANFRSFYTGLGHDGTVFENDPEFRQHLTGGILWAVRREHWLQ
jgi:type 1 glutamine amidotransferase